ncbi:UbiD family decarboxylase [Chloroflexota bacterium]
MAEDLRGWIERMQEIGELKKIEEADWDLEIGTITALNDKRRGPALLFDKIKGYPEGFRVLSGSVLTRQRVAHTLGLPSSDSDREPVKALRERIPQWEANLNKYNPRVVKGGPVMENVKSGGDINLSQFPAPKWHKKDGGRYIGTGHTLITKDPDTGEVNLGTYRVMIQNENTLGFHMAPGKHGRHHFEKYHARGQPAPILLSIGHHPLIFCVSILSLPMGMEYQYLGAMRGEPVKVIEEEVTGLPMPADSEIVIAGWCPPGKNMKEGPFGEFTGYYASGERDNPIIEVERVYYRNDPIILGSPPSRPPYNGSYWLTLMGSSIIENELRKVGVPDVLGVWTHEICSYHLVVVSIKQRFAGHVKQAALYASEISARGGLGGRYLIVVDEDIDVTDLRDVLWAMLTRSDPEKDIDIIRRARSTPLDPMIRRPATAFWTSRALIDACKPYEWKDEFPETINLEPEVVERVTKKWGGVLGF